VRRADIFLLCKQQRLSIEDICREQLSFRA
jgi:hypothetical protein